MPWSRSRPGTTTAGTPSLLRAINERSVLELVRRHSPISRAYIARESGLSKPTVSLALSGLLEGGLVREVGRSRGGRGPTAVLYEVNPSAGWVVGIDVGRQWVRAAIANISGAIVARRQERAQVRSADSLIGQIGSIAHQLAAEAGIRWNQVTAATLGSPGVLGAGGPARPSAASWRLGGGARQQRGQWRSKPPGWPPPWRPSAWFLTRSWSSWAVGLAETATS